MVYVYLLSAVAAFERGSLIEPVILPVCGSASLLSAVGLLGGEIVVGDRALTDALAQELSVRFKSRFTTDPASYEDVVRFVRGVLSDLRQSGALRPDDRFVVGCPAGWNTAARTRYRDLLVRAGMDNPQVISESRAAFLYAKYARTVALDVDILNESALVADIGSSTLDFAYIVDGRETGVGTFGETALGGGILDAALLRRAVERSRDRSALRSVLSESRSWYSYLEIEARRLKEEYFTRLATEAAPVVKKTLRVCYDGVQRLTLQIDNDEASHLIDDPLPELDGRAFSQAVSEALANAARLTAERPPRLLLLTGGASRMPFFREACQEAFPAAVVVSCPEPEFSIAKGLAYAGWVDENLRAFRQAIREEITDARVSAIASDALPALIPAVARLLCDLILDEAAIPIAQQWKRGEIRTLSEMNEHIAARVERILSSPLAQETLAPAVRVWLTSLTDRLQAMVDPICDRFEVPRPSDAAGPDRHRRGQRGAESGQLDGPPPGGRGAGRDRERGGRPFVRRWRHRADRHGAAGLCGGRGCGRGGFAAGVERHVRGIDARRCAAFAQADQPGKAPAERNRAPRAVRKALRQPVRPGGAFFHASGGRVFALISGLSLFHRTGGGNSHRLARRGGEISPKPLTAHGFYDNFIR